MKLADLIDRLVEIHNSKKDYNPEVLVMQEFFVDGIEHQRTSKVQDVATVRDELIVIGDELDDLPEQEEVPEGFNETFKKRFWDILS